MVLVKMLTKIDTLSMRGSLVMMMASISPSGREVSLVEQLHRSPRMVPPRFRLMAAVFHPESFLLMFSRAKDFVYQKMGTGGLPGDPQATGVCPGGRARPQACGLLVG